MTIDLTTAERPPATIERRGASVAPVRPATVRRVSRLRSLPVLVVHLLAFGIIVLGSQLSLLHRSIRLDEAQSLWQTDHSYPALLRLVAEDVHVPLYHLLLRTWRLALGPDIETARLLSLIFLLGSVPVFYRVARKSLRRRWALLAVLLFSSSPFLQWYGNEARMYTMLVFVTLVSQYFFLDVVEPDRARSWNRSWAGYAATAVVGAYVHYFFFFVLVTQGLYLVALVLWRRLSRSALLRLVAVAGLVTLAVLPWYLYFRANGSASGTRPSLPRPTSIDFSNVYSQFFFGFQSDGVNSLLLSAWPLLVLAALASVRVGGRMDRATGLMIATAVVPVLLAFLLSQVTTPFFLSRYMVPALPAVIVLVLRFLSGLGRPLRRVLAVVVLAVAVGGTVVQAADPGTPVEEDYREAAQLAGQARPQDVVVISSPFTIYPFEYYYDGRARVSTLPVWDRQTDAPAFDSEQLPEQVAALAEGHQFVYLVLSYDQGYQEEVYQYFAHHYEQTAAYTPSPGLRVLVYRVGYSEALPVGD
jgi:mannosyltransferase